MCDLNADCGTKLVTIDGENARINMRIIIEFAAFDLGFREWHDNIGAKA